MNIIKKTLIVCVVFVACAALFPLTKASAASTPTLSLVNNSSTVAINVSGADPNATVMFFFPSGATNSTGATTYNSIDIGTTNSSGSFTVSVAPNSYSLSGGSSVYVSVDGASSGYSSWPVSATASGQTTGLQLSQTTLTLTSGQTASIYAMNSPYTLTLQGNSNPSVMSASIQGNTDSSVPSSVFLNALSAGSSVISVCAGTTGCGTITVTVTAPTQTISFSVTPIYVVLGQSPQTIGIYGPGGSYSLSNSSQNNLSATINGSNITLQGLSLGQSTITVCGAGWNCGTATVNIVAAGTPVPTQTSVLAPVVSGFNQPPQIKSMTISSNNVSGLFFGAASTITLSFSTNVTVTNVQAQIAGQQAAVTQDNSGTYFASYTATGSEKLPLPVALSFTDLSGRVGHSYMWIGNSAATVSSASSVPPPQTAVSTPASTVVIGSFTKTLSIGMTDTQVTALQKRLKADGYFSGPITGYYGSQTKAAVNKYQSSHGLAQAGVVGPATRKLLNEGK